jgi:hypothetical protein
MHNMPNPPSTPWWSKMVVWWFENQLALHFHSPLDRAEGPARVIASLQLDTLNQFLNLRGYNLKPFTPDDVPHPSQEKEEERAAKKDEHADLNTPIGKYLFASPSGKGTAVLTFFNLEPATGMGYAMAGMNMGLMGMSPMYGHSGMGDMEDCCDSDLTRRVVNLLNNNLNVLRQEGQIPITAASPNWLCGGTPPGGCTTHGCPITPPIPVSGDATCTSSGHRWKLDLPQLSDTMKEIQGEGVTVFVLDTIPTFDQIKNTSDEVGDKNLLLQDMVTHMSAFPTDGSAPPSAPGSIIINYQQLAKRLDDNADPEQPGTGKDVYGRLFGFGMPDHGLFVAGIIHDLVPQARIECIRVLNDFGVGNVTMLVDALQGIQARMESGDLQNQSVVINMSLVATPANEDLVPLKFDVSKVQQIRDTLYAAIHSLTSIGAVFVASAGNDSDTTASPPYRMDTRYPAAFASDVIAVGAVDGDGNAATYSNYPALSPYTNGIATYGGALPHPTPPFPPSKRPEVTVTDALHGVFSSLTYPSLSAEDPSNDTPAPADSYAWAYWSGTSFATPIISALTARVMQLNAWSRQANALWAARIRDAITTETGRQAILGSGVTLPAPPFPGFGTNIGILTAQQTCMQVTSY